MDAVERGAGLVLWCVVEAAVPAGNDKSIHVIAIRPGLYISQGYVS